MNTTSKLPSYNTPTRSGRLTRALVQTRRLESRIIRHARLSAQCGVTLGAAED